MYYNKPSLLSISAELITELQGPCQTQYATETAEINAEVSDWILYYENESNYALGSEYMPSYALIVGDGGDTPHASRGFLSFDVSELAGKTIVSSTLKVYQALVMGSPYGDSGIGNMLVDHVNFGGTLEANSTNFDGYLTENIGTISEDATIDWKELDTVGDEVQTDLDAGRTTSQFKLRFSNDSALISNAFTIFENKDGTGGTTNYPVLEVIYRD